MLPGSARPRFTFIDGLLLAALAAASPMSFSRSGSFSTINGNGTRCRGSFCAMTRCEAGWYRTCCSSEILTTLRLSFWGSLVGLVVGLAVGLMRVSPNTGFRLLAAAYVETIRNIPPLVFIFIFYFFLASQVIPLTGIVPAVRKAAPETLAIITFLFGEPRQLTQFSRRPRSRSVRRFLRGRNHSRRHRSRRHRPVGSSVRAGAEARRYLAARRAAAGLGENLAAPRQRDHPAREVLIARLDGFGAGPHLSGQSGGGHHPRHVRGLVGVAAIYLVICFGLAQLFSALEQRSLRHNRR